jgi:hypothetical protein
VDREDKIDPPIQTKNFLYIGAVIFTFIVDGTMLQSYLLSLSEIPGNIVVPPLKIIFENNSFLISISHSVMEWWTI